MQDGVRIVLTRWSPMTAVGVLVATGVLVAGPLWALIDVDGTGERVFLVLLSAVFAIPLLWALWRTPKAMRGMGIAVDHEGVHEFDGGRTDTVLWSDVERVGFGAYSGSYRGLRTKSLPGFEVYRKGRSEAVIRCTLSPHGSHAADLEQAVRRFHPELWAGPFTHDR